ncbi:Melanoma Antigen [Manis pentadactyla]|nr:Melanoma Antigen [Manis pentadactyla]
MEELEGPKALEAPQELSQALAKAEDGQKAAQNTAENRHAELVEQEECREVEVDHDEGDDDEDDDEFLDESGDETEDESESEEDDYNEDEEREESRENSREGAEVHEGIQVQEALEVIPGTRECPMVQFRALFQNVVYAFLRHIHYNSHVQGQPHSSPVVVRHGSQEPEDPREGPVPWKREEPGEGPAAPQKQEEPGKGAHAYNIKRPRIEETVLQNDPSETESGAESWPQALSVTDLTEIVSKVSELSIAHEIVVNQDFYMEESVLPLNRFKMDKKTTGTLLELAAKSLLSNELAALHALDELPRALFVPLFIPAFLGRHKEILKAMSKLRQSFGSLHLCCRDLEIFDMSADRSILQFLDPRCISNLQADLDHLRELNTLVAQTVYLYSLRLSDIHFTCFAGRQLQTFLHCLRNLDSLQELDLSTLYVRNRLHRFLRVLPPQLKTLNLSSCGLSSIDVTILSQSSQATHLSQLNLSHNQIFSTAHGPFQTLLERASGTLQHLQINNCVLTDSILSALLPALSHCSCLRVLSFAFNPITMPMLMSLLQHLKSLMELKYVIYSIPLHCYRDWDVPDGLDQQQLAEVEAQLKAMLQAVQRDDMIWTTCPVKFP